MDWSNERLNHAQIQCEWLTTGNYFQDDKIIGLLMVQMLRAAGIRGVAIDLDERRIELARTSGAELVITADSGDPVEAVNHFTGGYVLDAVLFTGATESTPLSLRGQPISM